MSLGLFLYFEVYVYPKSALICCDYGLKARSLVPAC